MRITDFTPSLKDQLVELILIVPMEDQWVLLVYPVPFDLFDLGGLSGSMRQPLTAERLHSTGEKFIAFVPKYS